MLRATGILDPPPYRCVLEPDWPDLPPDAERARVRLARLMLDEAAMRGEAPSLAVRLGVACRDAQLPGSAVYQLLTTTLGVPTPRQAFMQADSGPRAPREALFLLAIDAYFGIQMEAGETNSGEVVD